MARDYPDYWKSMVPAKPIYGEGQTPHAENEEGEVDAKSYSDFIQYTIPTGYQWHIIVMGVCNNFGGYTRYQILANDVEMGGAYMDSFRRIPLEPEAALVVPAGVKYGIRVYNDDEIARQFTATIYGFLVEV